MEHEKEKKNRLKIVIPILCGLLICGIGLAIGLLDRAAPAEDSLAADTQNEVTISLPEPETTSNPVEKSDVVNETSDSNILLSSGVVLDDLFNLIKSKGEENSNAGLSVFESSMQLDAMAAAYGSSLKELEEYGRSIGQEQPLAQLPKEGVQQPTQPANASTTPTQQPASSSKVHKHLSLSEVKKLSIKARYEDITPKQVVYSDGTVIYSVMRLKEAQSYTDPAVLKEVPKRLKKFCWSLLR